MAESVNVTRQEFELMKTEHRRQSIAVESLLDGQAGLTRDVAELSERMNAGFEAVDDRLDLLTGELVELNRAFNGELGELTKVVNAHHAAVLSALMALGKNH